VTGVGMTARKQPKTNAIAADEYLAPDVPGKLPWHAVPVKRATAESLKGYGKLVDDRRNYPVEIVTWPVAGWRQCDPGTGNEGGTTHGQFDFWWEGDVLYGKNQAVGSQYLLGWSRNPGAAQSSVNPDRSRVLLWHANYHPDGGQLFFPLNGEAFVCPLALPGDDVKPEDFVAFYVDGGNGLYIHPNVWHEAVFPLAARASFYDEQGKVHARVSCNIAAEFGVFLAVPLAAPA
jgi:ureidoglycolate lyase